MAFCAAPDAQPETIALKPTSTVPKPKLATKPQRTRMNQTGARGEGSKAHRNRDKRESNQLQGVFFLRLKEG